MFRAVLFLTIVLISRQAFAAEGTHWATEKNLLVTVDKLSDERMLFYVEHLTLEQLADHPKFLNELKKRNLATPELLELANRVPETKPALPKIVPRPPQKQTNSRKPDTKIRETEAVLQYADRVKSNALRGVRRMSSNRSTIDQYRSYQSIQAIGNLQTIENLSIATENLYLKMWQIGHSLTRFPDQSNEKIDFLQKRINVMSADIAENEKEIDAEMNRIYFRSKPIKRND